MRHKEIQAPQAGFVDYPNAVAFMYSRQPVVVQCGSATYPVRVTVKCDTNGGASYTETRRLYQGRAEFDISRVMQILAPGPDGLLERLNDATDAPMCEVFSLTVEVEGVTVLDVQGDIQAMYGALDAGEAYGGAITRKLYRNYPQTLPVWRTRNGLYNFRIGSQTFTPTYSDSPALCRAVALAVPWLDIEIGPGTPEYPLYPAQDSGSSGTGGGTAPASVTGGLILRDGVPVEGSASLRYSLQDGREYEVEARAVKFIPDASPKGCGVYLRWLSRTGEVLYWLFDRQARETVATVAETFRRHYEGDPATPSGGSFRNEDKCSYEEARRVTVSAKDLTPEQFDDLCSLLTSPVVDMYHEPEAHTGYVQTGDHWVRVNVEAGTQTRRGSRSTPKLHTFEASLVLPRRNTVQL